LTKFRFLDRLTIGAGCFDGKSGFVARNIYMYQFRDPIHGFIEITENESIQ